MPQGSVASLLPGGRDPKRFEARIDNLARSRSGTDLGKEFAEPSPRCRSGRAWAEVPVPCRCRPRM